MLLGIVQGAQQFEMTRGQNSVTKQNLYICTCIYYGRSTLPRVVYAAACRRYSPSRSPASAETSGRRAPCSTGTPGGAPAADRLPR